MSSVDGIRFAFHLELESKNFVQDKSGVRLLEIVAASFVADEEFIFGLPNNDYICREIEWYESCSRNVNDIPPPVPQIWKAVATPEGLINSNYGWCIYSRSNYQQYDNVHNELKKNPTSRRATMVYNRPSMWYDYNKGGMSDFMCTNAVQYVIRDGKLHAIVQMRSNDAFYGYRNDFAWQRHVLSKLGQDLQVPLGDIHWNAGSLHLYEKDFWMVHAYQLGYPPTMTKKEYREKLPESPYLAS
jgi:thymidylate synthase